MNNNLQHFDHNLPTLHSHLLKQEIPDPVGNFLDRLYSGKGLKVNIPTKEEIEQEDSNDIKKPGYIEINFDTAKQFSINKPTKMIHLGYTRSPSYPTKEDKVILKKLYTIPVYSVVNTLGEMVVASPRTLKPLNFFDWMYEKYFNNFVWTQDEGPVNVGLFFMHKEDAEMYMHEICSQDPKGVEEYGIDIQASGLDNYYHLNKTSPPKTQVKLVGDLKEVDLLITKYSKDKNCRKNPKQKYTQNSFKGTPIYIMHPLYAERYDSNTKTTEKIVVNYGDNKTSERPIEKMVFFSKEGADQAWKTYASKLKELRRDIRVSRTPHLEVYNLENYLVDIQKLGEENIEKLRFIPSSESYFYIKKLSEEAIEVPKATFSDYVKENFKIKMKSAQRFSKGIIWLLTSDTLPTEDNSW